MSEKLAEVFEQYDMEIISTKKGRGSTILTTGDGPRILEPFRGSMVRLEQEYVLKQLFSESGLDSLDCIIPNRDGLLFTCDRYRQPFVLKKHFEGAECDMRNPEDVTKVVKSLSEFHRKGQWVAGEFEKRWSETRRQKEEQRVEEIRKVLEDGEELERVAYLYEISQSALQKAINKEEQQKQNNSNGIKAALKTDDLYVEDVKGRFMRHNAQIRKIGRFVSKVKRRNEFEKLFLEVHGDYYRQGIDCIEMLDKRLDSEEVLERHFGICHGSFNQHNVIIGENNIAIVHFERFSRGNQLNDLYQFSRKAMEKNSYNFELLKNIFEAYASIIELNKNDYAYLYVLFSYPEKFWKIANNYYNSNKAFLSPKYLEKLQTLILQEKEKKEMLGMLKRIVNDGI